MDFMAAFFLDSSAAVLIFLVLVLSSVTSDARLTFVWCAPSHCRGQGARRRDGLAAAVAVVDSQLLTAAGCWSVALWVNQTSRVSLSPLLCSSTSVNCKGRKKGQHKPGRSGENVRLQTDSIIFTSWRAAALLLLTFRFLGVESGNEMLGGGVGEVSVCNSRCR